MPILTRERSFYKNLFRLAVPIVLKNLITLSVSLADNIMVGALGDTSLGGAYMANQITTLLQLIVSDTGVAVLVMSTQYWGKRDTESIKKIAGIGLKIAMALGLAAWIMGFFFTRQTLGLYTDEAAVIAEGVKYLKILSFGYLLYCITEILLASMRCVETVKIGLVVSSTAFIVNIGLNYLLIFGKLGLPALGIRGAAVATVTARAAELLITLVYISFFDKKLRIRLRDLLRAGKPLRRDFLKYGLPVIAGGVIWGLNMNVQGAIIGRLGESAISSMSVAGTIYSVVSVVVFGISAAASIIIGKTVGQGDIQRVKQYAKTLQIIFLCFGVLTGTAIFASRFLIETIYPELNGATLQMVRQFLLVLTVTSVGTSYQACSLTGIVRAGGATNFVFLNDTFWVWCVVIPSALLGAFVFHLEPWLVFALLKGDQIYKCGVAVVKVNRFRWIKSITRGSGELEAEKV